MDKRERKNSAEKHLRRLLPIGTTVYTIRIDDGRRCGSQRYYAVLIVVEDGIRNISGHVAQLLGRKWSNSNSDEWANSNGVLYRGAGDLVEELAMALHGIEANMGSERSLDHKII